MSRRNRRMQIEKRLVGFTEKSPSVFSDIGTGLFDGLCGIYHSDTVP